MRSCFYALFVLTFCSCATSNKSTPQASAKPYVVLVSLDGFRYDYAEKFHASHLLGLAKTDVHAKSLEPIYPSKTFPSHYAMVTGLYAEHHGLVSNEFYDPARDAVYRIGDRSAVEDGSWYGGTPLWNEIEHQGLRTASFFWVGSDAPIQGHFPTYHYRYDEKIPNETRVAQVLAWLKLPESERPHFITVYFSDVDSAAHKHGVDADETRQAVLRLDEIIGELLSGVQALPLPVNVIIVSDHGMADLDEKKVEYLDDYAQLNDFLVLGRGPQVLLYLKKGHDPKKINETHKKLQDQAKHFRAYLRAEIPERFHYKSNPRVGDILIEPDQPYAIGLRSEHTQVHGANHGWDPDQGMYMHGIFYATGPAFCKGIELPTFRNIDIFPLVLNVLGLAERQDIDGHIDSIRDALQKH